MRSVNSLKNSNIRSLGDLVRQTEEQILEVKNFGKKSLQEIADLRVRFPVQAPAASASAAAVRSVERPQ